MFTCCCSGVSLIWSSSWLPGFLHLFLSWSRWSAAADSCPLYSLCCALVLCAAWETALCSVFGVLFRSSASAQLLGEFFPPECAELLSLVLFLSISVTLLTRFSAFLDCPPVYPVLSSPLHPPQPVSLNKTFYPKFNLLPGYLRAHSEILNTMPPPCPSLFTCMAGTANCTIAHLLF